MSLSQPNPEQSDIAIWGVAALICGAIAIVSANISAIIPESALVALHSTRIDGGNFSQARAQIAELRADSARLNCDTRTMLARLNLLDDDSGELIRRLAAVERSLPLLIETLPINADIDRSLLTASIGTSGSEVYQADGGVIILRQSPLFQEFAVEDPLDQPIPPRLNGGFGVAIGQIVSRQNVDGHISQILGQTGTMLTGMSFVLGELSAADQTRTIAGPMGSFEEAQMLCEPLNAMGLSCEPVPFEGISWTE